MPDPSLIPSLDLELTWRGAFGRVRVFDDHVTAETSFERSGRTQVPTASLRGWRIEPCDDDAVCVEFVTDDDTYRVLLDATDERIADHALRRVLGPPLGG